MGSVSNPTDNVGSETIATLWECNTIEKAQSLISSQGKSPFPLQNLISNTFNTAVSKEYLDAHEPKTGKVFSQVPISSAEEVDRAVQDATEAFASWSKTTRTVRSAFLSKIAKLIEENRELFAVWESIDQGKTLERARIEVDRAVSNFS